MTTRLVGRLRYFWMHEMDIYDTRVEDVIAVITLSPSRASEAFWYRFSVPHHTRGLAIGIGQVDRNVFSLPDGARMRLVHVDRDSEQEVNTTLQSNDVSVSASDNGLVSFTSMHPACGEWRLYITHTRPDAFTVQLVMLQRPLRELTGFVAPKRMRAFETAIPAILHPILASLAAVQMRSISFDGLSGDLHELPLATRVFLSRSLGVPIAPLLEWLGQAAPLFHADERPPITQLTHEIREFIRLGHQHGIAS